MSYQAKYQKKRYHTDPEYRARILKKRKEFYEKHREKEKAYRRERYHTNKEVREREKAQARAYRVRTEAEARKELIKLLGSKCQHCGMSDPRCLVIHHVNGRENKHHCDHRGDLKAYLRGEIDLMLLCANCHRILHYNLERKQRGGAPGT